MGAMQNLKFAYYEALMCALSVETQYRVDRFWTRKDWWFKTIRPTLFHGVERRESEARDLYANNIVTL